MKSHARLLLQLPAILAVQQSMISHLCLAISKQVARETDDVLCVWKCTGTPGATSLIADMCMKKDT